MNLDETARLLENKQIKTKNIALLAASSVAYEHLALKKAADKRFMEAVDNLAKVEIDSMPAAADTLQMAQKIAQAMDYQYVGALRVLAAFLSEIEE